MQHELFIKETFYDTLRMRYVTLKRSIVTSNFQNIKNGVYRLKWNARQQAARSDRREYRLTIELHPYMGGMVHAPAVFED